MGKDDDQAGASHEQRCELRLVLGGDALYGGYVALKVVCSRLTKFICGNEG